MKENLIRKFKLFLPWQDREEEAWLEEMARQGLCLVKADQLGRYTFEKSEPKAYAYRLDYQDSLTDELHYLKIFEDAGWKRITSQGGWHYFQQEVKEGKVPEIFTDAETKIKKYERVKALILSLMPLYLVVLVLNASMPDGKAGGFQWWADVCASGFSIPLFGALLILSGIGYYKLTQRIQELRKV